MSVCDRTITRGREKEKLNPARGTNLFDSWLHTKLVLLRQRRRMWLRLPNLHEAHLNATVTYEAI